MNILLIGGTGFIGSCVAEQLLNSRHQVSVLHRGRSKDHLPNDVHRIAGDANHLADHRDQLRKLRPDVVVNFILSSGRQAEAMMSCMRGIAGRIVAIGSMDVYRACGVLHRTESEDLQALPLTEESELRTQPAYSPTQMEAAKKIFAWATDDYDKIPVERAVLSDSALPGTVLRLPMVYGPGDRLHRFFPFIKRMDDGRQKILLQEGCAEWRASMGYVDNVAQAIALAATSTKASGRIYNVAEKGALTELEWAQLIAMEMNWAGEFVVLPKERIPAHLLDDANRTQHWVASSQRIRDELGYEEKIPRSEGVRRTIAWELERPPAEIPSARFDYAAEDAALEGNVHD